MTLLPTRPTPAGQGRPICQYKPTSSVFTARAACTRDARTRTLTCSRSSTYATGSTAPGSGCRDAVKIDHDQWPRLNKSAVSATAGNVGCIPGGWLTMRCARHPRQRCGQLAGRRASTNAFLEEPLQPAPADAVALLNLRYAHQGAVLLHNGDDVEHGGVVGRRRSLAASSAAPPRHVFSSCQPRQAY